MTEEKRFSSDLGPLHTSPITGFTGSISYRSYRDEFCGLFIWKISAPARQGWNSRNKTKTQNGGTIHYYYIALGCRSFVGSCTFINKANSRTSQVEIHTRQKLCHFDRYVAKAKLSCLKSLSQERGISHSWRHRDLQIANWSYQPGERGTPFYKISYRYTWSYENRVWQT